MAELNVYFCGETVPAGVTVQERSGYVFTTDRLTSIPSFCAGDPWVSVPDGLPITKSEYEEAVRKARVSRGLRR